MLLNLAAPQLVLSCNAKWNTAVNAHDSHSQRQQIKSVKSNAGGQKHGTAHIMLPSAAIILSCNKICLQIACPEPSLHACALKARMPLFPEVSRHVCNFLLHCIAKLLKLQAASSLTALPCRSAVGESSCYSRHMQQPGLLNSQGQQSEQRYNARQSVYQLVSVCRQGNSLSAAAAHP